MDKRFIMPGRKGQIPDDGGKPPVVETEHEADDDKPMESGLTEKAGMEGKQKMD